MNTLSIVLLTGATVLAAIAAARTTMSGDTRIKLVAGAVLCVAAAILLPVLL